jgi:hypothetical protein
VAEIGPSLFHGGNAAVSFVFDCNLPSSLLPRLSYRVRPFLTVTLVSFVAPYPGVPSKETWTVLHIDTNPSFTADHFHPTEPNSPRPSARFQDLSISLFHHVRDTYLRTSSSDLLFVPYLLYRPEVDLIGTKHGAGGDTLESPSRFCLPTISEDTT